MEAFPIFLRICGAAILAATVGAVLRETSRSGQLPVRIGGTVLLYGGALLLLLPLITRLLALTEGYALAPYATMLLRCLGIALLARIVSDVCRDTGEPSLSSAVEMAAKALILLLALPTVETLLATVTSLLSGGV